MELHALASRGAETRRSGTEAGLVRFCRQRSAGPFMSLDDKMVQPLRLGQALVRASEAMTGGVVGRSRELLRGYEYVGAQPVTIVGKLKTRRDKRTGVLR